MSKPDDVKPMGQVLYEAYWGKFDYEAAAQAVLQAAGVPELLKAARAILPFTDDTGAGWRKNIALLEAIHRTEAACRK